MILLYFKASRIIESQAEQQIILAAIIYIWLEVLRLFKKYVIKFNCYGDGENILGRIDNILHFYRLGKIRYKLKSEFLINSIEFAKVFYEILAKMQFEKVICLLNNLKF